MKYKIKYIEYNGKIDDMIFEFEDKYQLLSTFLSSDVTPFKDWVKADFDKVLSGESEYQEINGNVCCAEISKSTTKIYDNLAEDAMGNWCVVDTEELCKIIYDWCKEVEKFRSENHS